MGTYITHEGLPFHGALEKIRIRSCRVADLSLPGFDEKQLLEITRDGTAKLTQKTPEGTKRLKPVFHKPILTTSLLHSPKHSRTIAGNASRQLVDIGVSGF